MGRPQGSLRKNGSSRKKFVDGVEGESPRRVGAEAEVGAVSGRRRRKAKIRTTRAGADPRRRKKRNIGARALLLLLRRRERKRKRSTKSNRSLLTGATPEASQGKKRRKR